MEADEARSAGDKHSPGAKIRLGHAAPSYILSRPALILTLIVADSRLYHRNLGQLDRRCTILGLSMAGPTG
jgi:hypothetical protein